MGAILRIVVAAFVLAASAAATRAADAPPSNALVVTASSLGQKALNDPAAFDFVASLTTEIGQRLAGTEAHRLAVAWAEARLKQAGFENVHAEPFTLPAWIRGVESADIAGAVPQHLAVTALGGSVATDANGIEAEIALFRTYDDLLGAAPGSLNGKIAVVTQRMVRAQDGSGYGAANPIRRRGPSEAAKRGAVGYLLALAGHRQPSSAPYRGAQLRRRRAADSGGGAGHPRRRAARAAGGAGSGQDPAVADTGGSRERAVLERRRRDQGQRASGSRSFSSEDILIPGISAPARPTTAPAWPSCSAPPG